MAAVPPLTFTRPLLLLAMTLVWVAPLRAQVAAEEATSPTVQQQLDSLEQRWRLADEERAAREEVHRQPLQAWRASLAETDSGGTARDRVFDEVSKELERALTEFDEALDRLSAPSEVPSVDRSLDLAARTSGQRSLAAQDDPEPEASTRLRQEMRRRAKQLRAVEWELRWESAERIGIRAGALLDLRIQALDRLSEDRRRDLFRTQAFFEELGLEATVFGLWVRGTFETREHELRELISGGNLSSIGNLGLGLIRLIVVLVLWSWLRALRPRWLARARESASRSPVPRVRRTRQAWLELLTSVAPNLVTVAGLFGVGWAFGGTSAGPAIRLAVQIVLLWAGYRLAIATIVGGLAAVMVRNRFHPPQELRDKLLRSVRNVTRVVVIVLLVEFVVGMRLGGGILDYTVSFVGTFLVLLTLLGVAFNWRKELLRLFCDEHPESGIASWAKRDSPGARAALLAPFLALWSVWRGVTFLGRDLAMGFEDARRASAYVSRKRMERHAGPSGYAAEETILPPALHEALSEHLESSDWSGDDLPLGVADASQRIQQWCQASGIAEGWILIGRPGGGKRAWLDALEPAIEVPMVRTRLEERVTRPEDLAASLGADLGLPSESCRSLEAVGEHLLGTGPRVVVLERMENLFLSHIGGYVGLDAFDTLVAMAAESVFWIACSGVAANNHIRSVRPQALLFASDTLPSWTEEQIDALISRRIARAGYRLDFSDLVTKDSGSRDRSRRLEMDARETYVRLLWDHAEGNPTVALHFLRRSIDRVEDNVARVKMFRIPDPEVLGELGEGILIALAMLRVHGSLTPEELHRTTGVGEIQARLGLDRLYRRGVVAIEAGEENRYRISTHWQTTALRLLRRRNLARN